jgi:hypothetical protein
MEPAWVGFSVEISQIPNGRSLTFAWRWMRVRVETRSSKRLRIVTVPQAGRPWTENKGIVGSPKEHKTDRRSQVLSRGVALTLLLFGLGRTRECRSLPNHSHAVSGRWV